MDDRLKTPYANGSNINYGLTLMGDVSTSPRASFMPETNVSNHNY